MDISSANASTVIQRRLDCWWINIGLLVDKYRSSIYALAYSKLRNFHDAEDIAQEAFIKAYQKLYTLKRWDNFLAWLYSITSNLCKNFIRSQSNRPDREFIAEQEPSILALPAMNSYQDDLMHESLYEALASLPEIYRQAFFHTLGGEWTKPRDTIIDTGSHVSVIPHYIWTNTHHSFISDETEMGIGGNIVTGRLGWVTLRLHDEETISPPLNVKADPSLRSRTCLIGDDSMPLILGFEDVIRRIE